MTFQLDTSGKVSMVDLEPKMAWGDRDDQISWSGLSPFTQGYIEALLSDALPLFNIATPSAFSDLAPETLARIIADCEAFTVANMADGFADEQAGRDFWSARADGWHDTLGMIDGDCPPLTVQLGDDGKVRFAQ